MRVSEVIRTGKLLKLNEFAGHKKKDKKTVGQKTRTVVYWVQLRGGDPETKQQTRPHTMTTNATGFTQLVAEIESLMDSPSNTDSTGISLHRNLGWRPTFQPSDIDADDEVAVVYKNDFFTTDAYEIAEWICDNVVEWILDSQERLAEHGIKNPELTRSEIEAHLA